jgi:phosphoserine aminotransferase
LRELMNIPANYKVLFRKAAHTAVFDDSTQFVARQGFCRLRQHREWSKGHR